MSSVIKEIEARYAKKSVVKVQSGDTVRVHQRIKEGNKERVQVFEGLVIRVDRKNSLTYRMTVRKIASGIGVEKGFMLNAPNIEKVEVIKRSKVRRNYLSYIRSLTGKSARLASVEFDQQLVNTVEEDEPEEQIEDGGSSTEDSTDAPEAKDSLKTEEKAETKE